MRTDGGGGGRGEIGRWANPESIPCIIEDQAFLPSDDLAPPPSPLSPPASRISVSVFLCVAGRGEGGEEPFYTTGKKPSPL